MIIEIHRPELESLILEWMKSGEFQDVEDVLIQALKSAAYSMEGAKERHEEANRTGADLVAAMQASPYKEIDLTASRHRLPVRDASL